MLKRAMTLVALLCLGCSAQSDATAEVNRRIERQVRNSAELSPSAQLKVGERKPSEFGGWDQVTVEVVDQGVPKTYTFLLSKDGKSLVHYTKFDLSVDPYQRTMSRIDLSGRPVRGNQDAKVTVAVYDDFQCPYCARMYETLFDEIIKTYGDRIRIIYKDYPLYEIHPWAVRAAVNANCLAEQSNDAYWDFSADVHARQKEITAQESAPQPKEKDSAKGGGDEAKPASKIRNTGLDKLALDVAAKRKLDAAKLRACLEKRDTEKVRLSLEEGRRLGVSATPTLFINGEKLEGAASAEEVMAVLDRALRDAGEKAPEKKQAAAPAQK